MPLTASRGLLLSVALADAALSLALAPDRLHERTLIAATVARVACVSIVALRVRTPGQGLHAVIAVAMVSPSASPTDG